MSNTNDTYGMFSELFSRVFEELDGSSAVRGRTPFYSAPSFPPVNVEMDEETKDLYFTFALAGYSSDEISIKFDGDYLKLESEIIRKEKDKRYILKNGIKKTSFAYNYMVPMSKYQTDDTEASFEDGLLKVHIPAREEMKPKQVKINTK